MTAAQVDDDDRRRLAGAGVAGLDQVGKRGLEMVLTERQRERGGERGVRCHHLHARRQVDCGGGGPRRDVGEVDLGVALVGELARCFVLAGPGGLGTVEELREAAGGRSARAGHRRWSHPPRGGLLAAHATADRGQVRGGLRIVAVAIALVEDPGRLEQEHLGVEVEIRHDLVGIHRDVVDRMQVVERELEGATGPGHQLEDGLLDLFDHGPSHRLRADDRVADENLAERAARILVLLDTERGDQGGLADQAAAEQEVAQALRPGGPGRDDLAAVEADLGVPIIGAQAERAGAAPEVNELHHFGHRHVLEIARNAHDRVAVGAPAGAVLRRRASA